MKIKFYIDLSELTPDQLEKLHRAMTTILRSGDLSDFAALLSAYGFLSADHRFLLNVPLLMEVWPEDGALQLEAEFGKECPDLQQLGTNQSVISK